LVITPILTGNALLFLIYFVPEHQTIWPEMLKESILSVAFYLAGISFSLYAQDLGFADTINQLGDNSRQQPVIFDRVYEQVRLIKPAARGPYLKYLEDAAVGSNKRIAIRALLILARLSSADSCKVGLTRAGIAFENATYLSDQFLLADCYYVLGEASNRCGPNEKAVFYLLKTWQTRKELGENYFSDNAELLGMLGGILFRMQEYEKCIEYTRLALNSGQQDIAGASRFSNPNLIAISYQRLNIYDSAFIWFNRAYGMAKAASDTAWMGIIQGNLGYLYQLQGNYDKALPLLRLDYLQAVYRGDYTSAGNTLQRIARIYLAQNKPDSALLLAKQAYLHTKTIGSYYNPNHPMQAALTLSEVLEKAGRGEDALFYYKIYNQLSDSLAGVLSKSRLDVVETQLDFEKASQQRNALLFQQKEERQRRYYLSGAMILVLLTGWMYYKRKQQQQIAAGKLLEQEKKFALAEANAAREQLGLFTSHLVEKNEMIELLQKQMESAQAPIQPEELISQTILTEEDWLRFRTMFEKVYPRFFNRLQSTAPDATPAELRMAALIRLGVGNKHISSMLGVSADSVRKSKSRLRQRLQLDPSADLDQFMVKF